MKTDFVQYLSRHFLMLLAITLPIFANEVHNVSMTLITHLLFHFINMFIMRKTISFLLLTLSPMFMFSQEGYKAEEITALKNFLALESVDNNKTNGEQLGIEDLANWNPSTETAKLIWNDETPKRVKSIIWEGSRIKGNLDLQVFERLEGIECNDNAISALTFPSSMPNLVRIFIRNNQLKELKLPQSAPKLFVVNCANNQIERITLPQNTDAMAMFFLNNNKLTFSTLPIHIGEEWAYSPQDSIRMENNNNIIDLSKEYSISNEGEEQISTFEWFTLDNDNQKVFVNPSKYTSEKGIFTFAQEFKKQRLFCTMSNPHFPYLKLTVSVSPIKEEYIEEEIEALRSFLRQPSSKQGLTNANVLGISSDIDSWSPATEELDGIVWTEKTPKRVSHIGWVLKGIAGSLDLSSFEYLKRLETSKTKLHEIIFPENSPELAVVYCQESELTSLKLPKKAPKLIILCCNTNKLTELILPDEIGERMELDAQHNQLKSLTIPEDCAEKMYLAFLHFNQLTEVIVPDKIKVMRYFYLRGNKLTNFKMPSEHPALEYFWIDNNAMRFSTLPEDELSKAYTYAPQDTIRLEYDENRIDLSSEYSISRKGRERNTNYKWFRIENGREVELSKDAYDMEQGIFSFHDVEREILICKMTNENFPELTLICIAGENLSSGINAQKQIPDFNIYPNPATDILYIDLKEITEVGVTIYDLSGKIVKQDHLNNSYSSICLEGICEGSYLVKINKGEKEVVRKLVIR